MSGTSADATPPLPPELKACHAPDLKKTFERRRMPFLTIGFTAMAYAVYSTLFLDLQMRLAGIAVFTVLLIISFLFYNKQWEAYEQWKHLDIPRLMESSGGELELEVEFHSVFKEEGEKIMTEIDKALATANYNELGTQAHKLKGSALTIGYPEVAATALKIENLCNKNTGEAAAKLVPRLKKQMIYIDRLLAMYFRIRMNLLQGESKKDR